MQDVKDHKYLQNLGKHIRSIRKSSGMSQVDLAVRINNYAEQIGRIERGELNVSICTLKKIAEGLNIPLKDLLDF